MQLRLPRPVSRSSQRQKTDSYFLETALRPYFTIFYHKDAVSSSEKKLLWWVKFTFCRKVYFSRATQRSLTTSQSSIGLIVLAVEPAGIGELIIDDFFGPEEQLDFLFRGLRAVGAVNEVISF